ncbi:MAG: homoaconitate hydratase [Euryarchaeota archaeon]|nr:homoaconitate hydratase [Euryarchaeota archaeon]
MAEEPLVHNYNVEAPLERNLPEKVVFWDETLRDGEQTPGVYFTIEEKVELARLISDIGVDVMNVGIPAVSNGEVKAVKKITEQGLEASVLGAARTIRGDIDACLKADVDECAAFIAASPVHLKYKLKMSEEKAIETAVDAVEYAVDHGLKTTFVTEDTVRSDWGLVERIYNAAIDAGAERILYCDTVGVMTPTAMHWWLKEVRKRVPAAKHGVEEGVHIHNDFGMATALNMAALEEGVQCVNTTFGGLGERAGNTPFEEVVMALELLYDHRTGIKLDQIHAVSKKVEEYSGVPLAITKPITGYNAFTHESGIHTDGVIKNTLTYEPIQVETLARERRFVFGKHTGTHAVAARLEQYGIKDTPKEKLVEVANHIKDKTEGETKEKVTEFIHHYRDWDQNHKGVNDQEFWEICAKVGIQVPKGEKVKATA